MSVASSVPPPLHVDPEQPLPTEEDPLLESARQRHKDDSRTGDNLAGLIASLSAAALATFTWVLILRNNPKRLGYFALHPPMQTLALFLFILGILNLQRTTPANPESKRKGQILHQIFGGTAFTCITIGSVAMFVNKASHGWEHFASWHARFGLLTYILLVIQALVGAGSLWFGGAVFGGGDKAKRIYRYHRMSGYTIITLMLVTIYLAGGWATWVRMGTTLVQRLIIYTILPCLIWIGLIWRIRLGKMKKPISS